MALEKRLRWVRNWILFSSVTPQKRKPAVYYGEGSQQVERTHSPLFSTYETTPQAQHPVFVPPASITRQTYPYWSKSSRQLPRWSRGWSAQCEKLVTRLNKPEEKVQGDLIAVYNYPTARCREDTARLSSAVLTEGQEATKLQYRELQLYKK